MISTLIKENNIKLNFHIFTPGFIKESLKEDFHFFPLTNKYKNVDQSGLSKICQILSRDYDSVEYSVSGEYNF